MLAYVFLVGLLEFQHWTLPFPKLMSRDLLKPLVIRWPLIDDDELLLWLQ